jgi:cytochrome P450
MERSGPGPATDDGASTRRGPVERSDCGSSDATAGTECQSPPGPAGLPVVGNTLQYLRDPVGFYDRCGAYESDVVAYSVGGTDGYMLKHPADVERVLVTDASKFRRAAVIRDALGQLAAGGLFLADGETWERERTALQPAFYRERIETYAAMMVQYADDRADRWAGTDHVTVTAEMRSLTLEILAKTLLDVDIRGRESAIGDAAEAISDRFDTGRVSTFLPLWVPTPTNVRARRAIGEFDETIEALVADRRGSDDPPEDLLSMLLAVEFDDGTGLDEGAVRDHLFTFLFAGHETTALTLSYTLFLLANNPDRQRRLHQELEEVLDGTPTAGDLVGLEYLDGVVDEALRLYPPAYVVFREPTRDVRIRGFQLSAGTTLSLPQWVVHRDDRWYADPDAFRPERWTDEFRQDLPDYAYFPFGGGPRHCIGMRFALVEAKLVLATLARRFRFECGTEPPLELAMGITLQPEDPIGVALTER